MQAFTELLPSGQARRTFSQLCNGCHSAAVAPFRLDEVESHSRLRYSHSALAVSFPSRSPTPPNRRQGA